MKEAGDQIQNPAWAAKEDEQMVSFVLAILRSQAESCLESFEVSSQPWKNSSPAEIIVVCLCPAASAVFLIYRQGRTTD